MSLIFLSVGPEDGKSGVSAEDIYIKYYGNRSNTRLEHALNSAMVLHRTNDEYLTISKWIHNNAPKLKFDNEIKPILINKCIMCHSPNSGMNLPNLTTYDDVKKLIEMDTGEQVNSLVKVSHIHLFGLSLIFYLLGKIFILSDIESNLKRFIVILPFTMIIIDIASWWFTKYSSQHFFAYIVLFSGSITGISFLFQVIVSLYSMWLKDLEIEI